MHKRKKIALYCVFAVSYIVVILGVLRTHASYHLFYETYDVTWAACDIWLWYVLSNRDKLMHIKPFVNAQEEHTLTIILYRSLLEIHIGAMCANAPTLRVFYVHYVKDSALNSQPYYGNASSIRSKLSFWKKSSSPSSRGYILESHNSKQGNIVESNATFGGDNPMDVEMGRIRAATRMSVMSTNVEALPPMEPPAKTWKPWDRKI